MFLGPTSPCCPPQTILSLKHHLLLQDRVEELRQKQSGTSSQAHMFAVCFGEQVAGCAPMSSAAELRLAWCSHSSQKPCSSLLDHNRRSLFVIRFCFLLGKLWGPSSWPFGKGWNTWQTLSKKVETMQPSLGCCCCQEVPGGGVLICGKEGSPFPWIGADLHLISPVENVRSHLWFFKTDSKESCNF